uniref:Uncharacterized protein n=1 Tax=Arion vulgaris TaxID=1028688 RepID=A0A0B7ASU9_9EUPU
MKQWKTVKKDQGWNDKIDRMTREKDRMTMKSESIQTSYTLFFLTDLWSCT